MEKVHGHYLEDFGPYVTLFCMKEGAGSEDVCNALLHRAGLGLTVERMINKSFVAVATNYSSVMVLYVHDHTYILAAVPFDQYEKKLKDRHPRWDVPELLERLPSF